MKNFSYNKTKVIRLVSLTILFIALLPKAFEFIFINETINDWLFIAFTAISILLTGLLLWVKLRKKSVLEDETSRGNDRLAESMSNACVLVILSSVILGAELFNDSIKFNVYFIWLIILTLMGISDGYYLYLERSDDIDARDED